jgi:isoquinoline 1-oxidoreductase
MTDQQHYPEAFEPERYELREGPAHLFAVNRREFLEIAGAGLLILASAPSSPAQRGGSGGGPLEARLHIGEDGTISILTGKIEEGQGARTELMMAAAEELRVPLERVRLLMADTDRVPNDGGTSGSRTTPGTVPPVRRAAATARALLLDAAGRAWKVDSASLEISDGAVRYAGKMYTYADLARSPELAAGYKSAPAEGTAVSDRTNWKILGTPQSRPDGRDIVTGSLRYPSDIVRPGMLYGLVMRPPSYQATLESVDLSPARKMAGVTAVQDGNFAGCAAPTSFAARKAVDTISATAQWKTVEHPASSDNLYDYLKQHAKEHGRTREQARGSVDEALAGAHRRMKASYRVPYAQHAPMEPRAAVAEWQEGRLTVWTGSSNPFNVRQQLADAFRITPERVRVIVPDMGGGFGGKHTGEAAIGKATSERRTPRGLGSG